MEQKKLSRDQYNKLFEEYLEEIGPNPGESFNARSGWYSIQKGKFNSKLKKEGFTLPT